MMYPKPKSAPGRVVNSKFVKNRTNAMKEIEAWVKKDDDPGSSHEASRMSGQLTDNVTEDRMLRAKLWELSKERYKFLTQNAYEKKMFTDRMQRKSSALLQRASSAAAGTASRDSKEGETAVSRAGSTSAKQRWNNARMALIERLNPIKQKNKAGKSEDDDKAEKGGAKRRGSLTPGGSCRGRVTPAATPISVAPASTGVGSGKVILAPLPVSPVTTPALKDEGAQVLHKPPPSPMPPSSSRNVKFNKDGGLIGEEAQADSAGQTRSQGLTPIPDLKSRQRSPAGIPAANGPPLSLKADAPRPLSGSLMSSKPNSAISQRTKTWGSTQATTVCSDAMVSFAGGKRGVLASRYGMRLESKTSDPRYAQLEHSLSPLQKQRVHSDVKSIVKTFDALHVPSKKRPEAKPKTELKALEYIQEQGFLLLEKL